MPSRNIEDCCKELKEAWPKLLGLFKEKFPGWEMRITCTHRTPEEQFLLFQKGRVLEGTVWRIEDKSRIVTFMDGHKLMSNHNYYPAKALDVVLRDPKGQFQWDSDIPQWQALPELGARVGLVNGGAWKRLKDFPHFEVNDLV